MAELGRIVSALTQELATALNCRLQELELSPLEAWATKIGTAEGLFAHVLVASARDQANLAGILETAKRDMPKHAWRIWSTLAQDNLRASAAKHASTAKQAKN